ncbi:MAG TPA: glycosyltransferase, partial [Candidatus Xenobia bacterium]
LLISHTCQSPTEGQPKAEWLSRLGVDLTVLVPDRWKEYDRWRTPVIVDNPRARYHIEHVWWPWTKAQWYLHWYPKLHTLLRQFRPDVIDLWEEPWGLVSAHACLLRRLLLPTARIVSETEQNVDKHLPFPFESFRRYTLRQADHAVGRNQEAVDIIRRKGFRGPAEVVPNAVDSDLFSPGPRDEIRHALGWSGFVAGYVGRWVEEKGLQDALDALPSCPDDVSLAFIGGGPMESALRRPRVHLVPGRPQPELPALLRALDALILPSRTTARWKEQFGRVIIEAQACGVPVIGSNSGAIPEVLEASGLVVPERSPGDLAAAICRLRDDPGLRRRLAEGGRQRVLEKFTWQSVAQRMLAIYERTMAL